MGDILRLRRGEGGSEEVSHGTGPILYAYNYEPVARTQHMSSFAVGAKVYSDGWSSAGLTGRCRHEGKDGSSSIDRNVRWEDRDAKRSQHLLPS